MVDIEIKNLSKDRMVYQYDMRVDRDTIFGNPFHISNLASRDVVCNEYEKYFDMRMDSDLKFQSAFNLLIKVYKQHGKLRLFCWCSPERCHAEYIKQRILDFFRRIEHSIVMETVRGKAI